MASQDMVNNITCDARKMFKHACAFADCAYFCETESCSIKPRTQWHTVPNIVNSVFACEVFIKSLLVYHGMTHIQIKKLNHGLVGLWNELKMRDSITTNAVELALHNYFNSTNEALFDEMLGYISNAFIEWRYIYEGYDVKINRNFLICLRNCLRNVCCQKLYNKTWSEFVESQSKWDDFQE